jgi:hypothetical protein
MRPPTPEELALIIDQWRELTDTEMNRRITAAQVWSRQPTKHERPDQQGNHKPDDAR